MSKTVLSRVRTDKLWCSLCSKRIKKGETAYFELEDGHMEGCWHESCGTSDDFMASYYETVHSHDSEALGQE